MTLIDNSHKKISREKTRAQRRETTFCTDCVLDWCKIRNKVSYCSQKYKGTSCYSCNDNSCKVKRIAGA